MGDFGVEVVEVVSAVEFSVFAFFTHYQCENGLQEDVAVGASGRDGEGGLLFDYWAFDVGFGRDEPYADTAVVFFVVAVVGGDVEDGRKAAAETCGEAALVKLYVLHGVGVEGREEAAEVVDVVHGYAVQEEEIFVGSTATDVHACSAFTAVLDAGEELDGFDYIGFTEKHGHGFDLLDGYLDAAGDGALDVLDTLAHYPYFLQCVGTDEFGIDTMVGIEGDGMELGFASHKGDADDGCVALEGEAVAAVLVGDGTFVRKSVVNGGTDERLSCLGISDDAGDGVLGMAIEGDE